MAKLEIKSTTLSKADKALYGFSTMASVDNPKASKAFEYGWLNGILYMAPSDTAGVGDLCVFAGACKALCLGEHSGQASMRKEGQDNNVTLARKARAKMYQRSRQAFLAYVHKDVARLARIARKLGLKLCYRFNGSTDVGVPLALILAFPDVTFIDYTKNPNRMMQYLQGKLPANYHMTFSRDVHNERLAERFLQLGGNVAVVGDIDSIASDILRSAPRVNGDAHDIRIPELDGRGKVIVLTPKGHKAARDTSGFVLKAAA